MISRAIIAFTIILICHLGGFTPLARAQSSLPVIDRPESYWNSLAYKAKKLLGTVNTRIVLDQFAAADVEGELIASPQGENVMPSESRVFHLTVDSAIDPMIGTDELLVTRVWFSPREAAALQRVRSRKGKEQWEKSYRWTQNGVYRLRLKPQGAAEENLPAGLWTDKEVSFYPYDLQQSGCLTVSEPSLLLYVASAADLAVGDQPRQLCAFNKKQLHLVQFQAAQSQRVNVKYLEKSPRGESMRAGDIEALKLSFTTRPLIADEAGAEAFSFLGLKGNFDIFIDKASRIPVQISGQLPGIGRVDIKLEEAQTSPEKNK